LQMYVRTKDRHIHRASNGMMVVTMYVYARIASKVFTRVMTGEVDLIKYNARSMTYLFCDFEFFMHPPNPLFYQVFNIMRDIH
jgi:hypothetical protein